MPIITSAMGLQAGKNALAGGEAPVYNPGRRNLDPEHRCAVDRTSVRRPHGACHRSRPLFPRCKSILPLRKSRSCTKPQHTDQPCSSPEIPLETCVKTSSHFVYSR